MPVINRIAEFAPQMAEWRRWLHRHPEIGFDLPRTSAFVAERLREIGVDEIHEGWAQTGIVAIVNGQGEGPTIGLRADMDALPMEDRSGADWASQTPGAAHTCGHDGHTAMLLGAARYLAETRNFRGRVALIFQPAEEEGGGAGVMVREGLIERFGIGEVYALHNDPGRPLGRFETAPGPIMAAVDDFWITLHGEGGHAARPHRCIDPIPPALAIVQAMQTIVTRNRPPLDSMVISVTQVVAGTTTNVIPAEALIAGTVRTYAPEMRDLAEARIREIVAGHAAAYGVAAEIRYSREYPATVNDPAKAAFAMEVAAEISGPDRIDGAIAPRMGAEDFAYLLEARPGAYVLLGQGEGPGCHHPAFDFNDEIAPIGASFFARLVERAQPVG